MLFIIKSASLFFLSFITTALAEEENLNSWIKELTHQAEALSKTHQDEARSIVEGAIAAQPKSCTAAKELAHQGDEIARNILEPGEGEARYPRLLVFVSFSMPLPALKTLGSQVNAVGGTLVLRGLVKGSFKETAKKLKELQEEIIIDPILYEAYEITSAPTFILRSESTKKVKDGPYDRLSGNVSLEYALEQFALRGDQIAVQLLKEIRP